jgi:hypothetical protein
MNSYVSTNPAAKAKLNFTAKEFTFILLFVTELDKFWAEEIAQALEKAKAAGRQDIADYLNLRASNDFLRSAAVKWLMREFAHLGEEFRLKGRQITLETNTSHSFVIGHSTMVGSRLAFRCGLRGLTIEAGWTRTPEHGFMRGGGLAFARLSHYGFARKTRELLLIKIDERPVWVIQEDEQLRTPLFEDFFHEHFSFFLEL